MTEQTSELVLISLFFRLTYHKETTFQTLLDPLVTLPAFTFSDPFVAHQVVPVFPAVWLRFPAGLTMIEQIPFPK